MSTSAQPGVDPTRVRAPESPRGSNPITVTSATFAPGGTIPREAVFTGCGGQNVSPQLSWRDFPAETKSFALTVFDPDAPTGSGYWHWVAFDIPANVTSLEADASGGKSPGGGKTGYTDFGTNGYSGPCPPAGDQPHRYVFTVYALDVPSVKGAGQGTTGATLVFQMRGHVLATGTLVGRFGMK
jgi:Raf kinase inhibitor-like YbhB/YbcL family protein